MFQIFVNAVVRNTSTKAETNNSLKHAYDASHLISILLIGFVTYSPYFDRLSNDEMKVNIDY